MEEDVTIMLAKRQAAARRLVKARGDQNKPYFEGWSVAWKAVFDLNERLVLAHLYGLTVNLFSSPKANIRNSLLDQNGGVHRRNSTIAEDTGVSIPTVKRTLDSLESKGAIFRKQLAPNSDSRVIYVNLELLEELDAAWMIEGNVYDPDQGLSRSEWVELRKALVVKAWKEHQGGGSFWTTPLVHSEPPLVYKDSISLSEVSSSKKPGPLEDERTGAASPIAPSRRRIPQGLLTPQADPSALFKRNGNATPGKEAAIAADTRVADSLLDYWNKAMPHKKQNKFKRGGEVNSYYLDFTEKLDKLLKGTLFTTGVVAAEYHRKFSVAEVQRAIDFFASYPPNLQDGVKYIGDFLRSDAPNKQPFRNGCGRSWMLRCLYCDDPYTPALLEDTYPDLTEHLRKKFAYTILKGNPMPLDTIDKNNMVKAAAMIMELYHEHEEQLSRLNQTPEVIANKLMEHAARWNRNGATTPSTLCQPALFKALVVELTKNGYLRQDVTLTEDAPEPMGRVGDIIADTRTPEEKEKDRIRAMVYTWPEAVRESMMKAKGIPLDILD